MSSAAARIFCGRQLAVLHHGFQFVGDSVAGAAASPPFIGLPLLRFREGRQWMTRSSRREALDFVLPREAA